MTPGADTGTRYRGVSFFDNLADPPVRLPTPTVVEGKGVTHLYYRLR